MPRITISIPAELKTQLGQPRVRQALNISRICQEALRREVRRLLDVPTDVERMNRILERLRGETLSQGDRWFAQGSADARSWVEHQATLGQLRQLGELKHQERLANLQSDPPKVLREALSEHVRQADFNSTAYLDGWSATIGPMWETIKRHL